MRFASLALAAVLSVALVQPAAQSVPRLRFGVVTDIHHADIDANGARTYRASAAKLEECVRAMNDAGVAFLVELGDFKDQDKTPDELRTAEYLRQIETVFAGFKGPRYHVIGNHDTDSISKAQFLEMASNTGIVPNATSYTFVQQGIRFVVLDANHKADGTPYDRGNFEWADANIDPPQLEWLARTLAASSEPAIVMVHQQLDGAGAYYIRNAPAVRAAIEKAGNVIAVLQGHRHEGAFSEINGIPYFTFRGVIEGPALPDNAYSVVEVLPDFGLRISGYGRAESKAFRARGAERFDEQRREP